MAREYLLPHAENESHSLMSSNHPLTLPFWQWISRQRASLAPEGWEEAVHPTTLCLHLNFHGEGVLTLPSGEQTTLKPQTLTCTRGVTAAARTQGKDRHECLSLVYPDVWLAEYLREVVSQVPEYLRDMVTSPEEAGFALMRPLTPEDQIWARSLMMGCLSDSVRRMLDTARMTDFLLKEVFTAAEVAPPASASISRSERASRERIEKVKALIMLHLDENHDLDSLASAVGCSPHYLSRTFAKLNGIPLKLWIRRARIEKAAELIASGRCNVSEAAMDVGYSSFSHFSRVFQEEKGVSPSKWVAHLTQTRFDLSP